MKKILIAVLMALALTLVGCAKARPDNMFHVVSADPCDRPSVIGIMGDKEYALNVENPPLYVACPGGMSMADVGKNFPATLDMDQGGMTIEVPVFDVSREEFAKGDLKGHQTGSKKVHYVIKAATLNQAK